MPSELVRAVVFDNSLGLFPVPEYVTAQDDQGACRSQDVSAEISHIRSLGAKANVTLAAVSTFEEELNNLVEANKPARSWVHRLLGQKRKT